MCSKTQSLYVVMVLLLFGRSALAEVPPLITFTGYAQTEEGPVEGDVSLTISLYDSENAPVDEPFWRDTFEVYAIAGRFSVLLGSNVPLPSSLPQGPLYLGIMVNGGEELSPRLKVASVPYAFRCGFADDSETAAYAQNAGHAESADSCTTASSLDGYTVDRFVLAPSSCSEGQVIKFGGPLGEWVCAEDNNSGGTVTSVALVMPQEFEVIGSPITSSGTITAEWKTVAANTVFAGPTSGQSAVPGFRGLVPADIPELDASKITTGVLPASRGGTGLSSPGPQGNLLRSNGNIWESWTPNFLTAEIDGIVGNEVVGAADQTLTRSGSGTASDPYKLALNLANANTWTGVQTFNPSTGDAPFVVPSSKTGVVSNLNADMLDGKHASDFALASHTHALDSSSITGVLPVSKGGTGLSSPGTAGNLLRSNGTAWESWTPNFLTSEVDGVVGNEVVGAANSTLTRSGSGTASDPYKLALNLANDNTWTGLQRFSPSSVTVPFAVSSSHTGVVTNLNADMLDGLHSTSFALAGTVWNLKGNAGTDPAVDFLGTTDDKPVVIRSNSKKMLTVEWREIISAQKVFRSGNIIGVPEINWVAEDVTGVVIGGGGDRIDPYITRPNQVAQDFGVIVGGINNSIGGDDYPVGGRASFIGGGELNRIVGESQDSPPPSFAMIVGGYSNTVQADYGFIGGGRENKASGQFSFVGGGVWNSASGRSSFVGGGTNNRADGEYSFVGGGNRNSASGEYCFVGGGYQNSASGEYSFVGGGTHNIATGRASFAGGAYAVATYDGCFVWRGWEDASESPLGCEMADQFLVRARGGVKFCLGDTIERCCTLRLEGGYARWSCDQVVSDRRWKLDIVEVDPLDILDRVASLEVSTWSYIETPMVKHIGPMARDFYELFGFGSSPDTISPQDLIGVTLAAVQGLNIKVDSEVEALKRQIEEQNREIAQLKAEIAQLRALLKEKRAQ